jgi:transcriptional regulator with XRE-family HTH domain
MFIQTGMASPPQLNKPMMRTKMLEQTTRSGYGMPTPVINTSKFIWSQKVTAVLALMVGTGGLLTADFVSARNEQGYRLQAFGYPAYPPAPRNTQPCIRNSVENLNRARAVIKPTVTELASLFSVSRQAIYNWQSGNSITPENETRLEQFARAADIFDAAGFGQQPSILRRKLPGGSTFFDRVRAGEPAEVVAQVLVTFVSHELAQRQALTARLRNRTRTPIDVREIGAPHYDESA